MSVLRFYAYPFEIKQPYNVVQQTQAPKSTQPCFFPWFFFNLGCFFGILQSTDSAFTAHVAGKRHLDEESWNELLTSVGASAEEASTYQCEIGQVCVTYKGVFVVKNVFTYMFVDFSLVPGIILFTFKGLRDLQ